ncbi:MAG: hypothetical protein FD124_674 [Alphaproteobacteria bacterium]|nr:MAG: hypothetical protein FD160_195 [Caulobacteraceae bacterium]TPW08062.1 MAG: hypothetical protein FD124_674 [Alphaproteobacteria bacterium]
MRRRPRNRFWKNDAASGRSAMGETRGSAARGREPRGIGRTCDRAGKAQRSPVRTMQEKSKGPLTQRARRARRGNVGPPDAGAARGFPTAGAHPRHARRTRPRDADRTRRRRPPKQEPSDRQNQHHKKPEHIRLHQNLRRMFPICSFPSSNILERFGGRRGTASTDTSEAPISQSANWCVSPFQAVGANAQVRNPSTRGVGDRKTLRRSVAASAARGERFQQRFAPH